VDICFDTWYSSLQLEFMQKKDWRESATLLIPILDQTNELQWCLTDIAGIALTRRVALMAAKAGLSNLVVVSSAGDARLAEVLRGTDARLATYAAMKGQIYNGPILVLSPNCLPDKDFFSRLDQMCIRTDGILLWKDGYAMLLGIEHHSELLDGMKQACSFEQLANALKTGENRALLEVHSDRVGLPIRHANDCAVAETVLLSGLVKATEGWMALHINRKISLAVTRRLMHTSVTPNHMTWVSMVLGLVGAVFFLSHEHGMQILGALFFLLHSILDGCDGELARLKFMESRLGGILDFWSDNIVHMSVFAAMGIGWAEAFPDSLWPWLCATLAVVGTAVSASLVYFHTMHAESKAGPLYTSVSISDQKSAIVRIADILSRRDFIYLVLVLALFGQIQWFLVMTAIGAPVYALLLIGIMIRE